MKPEDFADNDPYLIIAADSHAGLPTNDYRPYLEKKYHDRLDGFLLEQQELIEASTRLGVRDDKYAKKWFEEHDEELAGGWDAIKRDQTLDSDGVAGEVVYPDSDAVESRTAVPFGAGLGLSGDLDPELGLAGANEMARVHFAVLDEFAADNGDAECFDEFGKFLEQTLGFPALLGADVGSDEQGTLDHFRLFLDLEHRLKESHQLRG